MNWELLISITMLLITIATLVLNLIVKRINEKLNSLEMAQSLLHEMIKINHNMINRTVEMVKTQNEFIGEFTTKKQKKETRTK